MTIRNKLISFILLPLFWLSYFIPQKKNLWVFGAWFGERYSDNSRYLFEYVNDNIPEISAVWLTRSKSVISEIQTQGLTSKLIYSVVGYFTTARAEVVILTNGYNDVNRFGLPSSVIVQLWHGVPLKKIKNDDRINENNKSLFKIIIKKINPLLDEKYSIMFAQGKVDQKRFSSAFKMKIDDVKIMGSPRDDIILRDTNMRKDAFVPKNIYKKYILFAPTFRQSLASIYSSLTIEIIEKLSRLLKKYNCLLLINPHYADKTENLKQILENNEYQIYFIEHLNNLSVNTESDILSNDSIDINKILPQIDILITDYSSVYFDYLQLNRPIIFTGYDVVEYQKYEREFYDDYNEVTPGDIADNWEELIEYLENIINGNDCYSNERKKMNNLLHCYHDTSNCERIVNTIKQLL